MVSYMSWCFLRHQHRLSAEYLEFLPLSKWRCVLLQNWKCCFIIHWHTRQLSSWWQACSSGWREWGHEPIGSLWLSCKPVVWWESCDEQYAWMRDEEGEESRSLRVWDEMSQGSCWRKGEEEIVRKWSQWQKVRNHVATNWWKIQIALERSGK